MEQEEIIENCFYKAKGGTRVWQYKGEFEGKAKLELYDEDLVLDYKDSLLISFENFKRDYETYTLKPIIFEVEVFPEYEHIMDVMSNGLNVRKTKLLNETIAYDFREGNYEEILAKCLEYGVRINFCKNNQK